MLLLFIGAIIGGLISWLITHEYYKKSSKEQKKFIEKLSKDLKEVDTLKHFEVLLEKSKWKKEFIGHNEVWISQENNTFQIHHGDFGGSFTEPWITIYPDQNASRYPVYLKIGDTTIKEITFISLDGGRIFVPMTERDSINNKPVFYWDMASLPVKVCKIIGSYYIYKDLYGVARMSKVEIRNSAFNNALQGT